MILSKEIAEKKLRRMAMQVAERNHDKASIILIGIIDNGMAIAEKIAAYLQEVFPGTVQLISLKLDKKQPEAVELSDPLNFNDSTVLLIDDVANSGRTMLYALKPLLNFLPHSIQTLALVERTHKQFPVHLDYVGMSVSTSKNETIKVEVTDGEIAGAYLQ
ncbi:MAG: phosphoribosyltransferase [Chitinophagaceae bacterium]|nr:MAG: phosphoribosyltransferase [Chitinophagaceae bacterium]